MTRAEKIARNFRNGLKPRPWKRRLLLKVQLSITTDEPVRQVYVYNQDHSVEWMGNASRSTVRFMADKLKRYAFAHLTKDKKISLDGYAPEQDW